MELINTNLLMSAPRKVKSMPVRANNYIAVTKTCSNCARSNMLSLSLIERLNRKSTDCDVDRLEERVEELQNQIKNLKLQLKDKLNMPPKKKRRIKYKYTFGDLNQCIYDSEFDEIYDSESHIIESE